MDLEHPHILTDCDGVLLDWADSFRAWIRNSVGAPPRSPGLRLTPNNPDAWLLRAYGMGIDRAVGLVEAFQVDPAFGCLPPYDDAAEWVPRIAADHGVRFVLVSSPGVHPETLRLRSLNLRRAFGDVFAPFGHLPALACKREALAAHPPSLWFDDHVPHVLGGHAVGHHAFHFDRFGDLDPSVPARIRDWGAVHALLASRGRRAGAAA